MALPTPTLDQFFQAINAPDYKRGVFDMNINNEDFVLRKTIIPDGTVVYRSWNAVPDPPAGSPNAKYSLTNITRHQKGTNLLDGTGGASHRWFGTFNTAALYLADPKEMYQTSLNGLAVIDIEAITPTIMYLINKSIIKKITETFRLVNPTRDNYTRLPNRNSYSRNPLWLIDNPPGQPVHLSHQYPRGQPNAAYAANLDPDVTHDPYPTLPWRAAQINDPAITLNDGTPMMSFAAGNVDMTPRTLAALSCFYLCYGNCPNIELKNTMRYIHTKLRQIPVATRTQFEIELIASDYEAMIDQLTNELSGLDKSSASPYFLRNIGTRQSLWYYDNYGVTLLKEVLTSLNIDGYFQRDVMQVNKKTPGNLISEHFHACLCVFDPASHDQPHHHVDNNIANPLKTWRVPGSNVLSSGTVFGNFNQAGRVGAPINNYGEYKQNYGEPDYNQYQAGVSDVTPGLPAGQGGPIYWNNFNLEQSVRANVIGNPNTYIGGNISEEPKTETKIGTKEGSLGGDFDDKVINDHFNTIKSDPCFKEIVDYVVKHLKTMIECEKSEKSEKSIKGGTKRKMRKNKSKRR